MLAAVYKGNHRVATAPVSKPSIGADEVLLRVHSCGVCGTDIGKVNHDLIPEGSILGHEVAGYVEEVGDRVSKFEVGDRLVVAHHTPCYSCHYCRHGNVSMCAYFKKSNLDPGGFAEYLRIPAMHVQMTAHKVPRRLPLEHAIFMEPLACILRNIKRADLQRGDSVLIVGLGSVGLLSGQVLKKQGMRVIGLDLKEDRLQVAKNLGFDHSLYAEASQEIEAAIKAESSGRGVDLVILTAGNGDVYSHAIKYLRGGGKLSIFAGQAPEMRAEFLINQIYKNEITIFASYSPSPLELTEALDMLVAEEVNITSLSPKTYSLSELNTAIEAVNGGQIFKGIVQPQLEHSRNQNL